VHSESRRSTLPVLLTLGLFLAVGVVTSAAHAEPNESEYRSFIDAIGETLYAWAWPTAQYERVGFGGVTPTANGAEIAIRLHGKSSFSDTHLWTDVIVEVRNGEVVDLRWGRNNAILAQPGETMKALGQALAELTAEYQRELEGSGGSSSSASGQAFHFKNNCDHPVRLAIHFRDLRGKWRTEAWWSFAPGESAYLNSTDQRRYRSDSSIWYYYVEATDGSGLTWSGDFSLEWNGLEIPMAKTQDSSGSLDLAVKCE